ncbi:MAG: ribonuclease III [Bacteroidales bacterium]|jgi:ribonuclease-3|nr:ribonuclease III [Bacteroidales bacterium]
MKLLFCKKAEKEFFIQLYELLGFMPRQTKYYRKALTHKSITARQQMRKAPHNERLEFLGDSVLDTVLAEYLFQKYPDKPEGYLSKMKSKIVSRKSLNKLGLELGVHKHLQANVVRLAQNDAMGNTVEALIGAIYLDKGFNFIKAYILGTLMPHFSFEELEHIDTNYKSQLLEYVQKYKLSLSFVTDAAAVVRAGSDENFFAKVFIDDVEIAEAHSFSKKDAEQKAAKIAMELVGEAVDRKK